MPDIKSPPPRRTEFIVGFTRCAKHLLRSYERFSKDSLGRYSGFTKELLRIYTMDKGFPKGKWNTTAKKMLDGHIIAKSCRCCRSITFLYVFCWLSWKIIFAWKTDSSWESNVVGISFTRSYFSAFENPSRNSHLIRLTNKLNSVLQQGLQPGGWKWEIQCFLFKKVGISENSMK